MYGRGVFLSRDFLQNMSLRKQASQRHRVTFTLAHPVYSAFSMESFSFPSPSLVETLTIERETFSEVKNIMFIDLLNLKELQIGAYSFTRCRNTMETLVYSASFGEKVVFRNRSLVIRNCPRLINVSIGEGSMQDVVHLELKSWFATRILCRSAGTEVVFGRRQSLFLLLCASGVRE